MKDKTPNLNVRNKKHKSQVFFLSLSTFFVLNLQVIWSGTTAH